MEKRLELSDSMSSTCPMPLFKVADLVVAKTNFLPQDIIQQFDLSICKASCDGDTFYFPDAKNTFNSIAADNNSTKCIHKPQSNITRYFNELTTFFQGTFEPVSTAHRLYCLEQHCRHLKDVYKCRCER